jgi:hypothetical protein
MVFAEAAEVVVVVDEALRRRFWMGLALVRVSMDGLVCKDVYNGKAEAPAVKEGAGCCMRCRVGTARRPV